MAFIRTDLSPVGAQGRAGVVPQLFSYTTTDDLTAVKTAGYFPLTNEAVPPLKNNNMLGNFRTNDWINVVTDNDTTPVFTIIFIDNDGSDGLDISVIGLDISAA